MPSQTVPLTVGAASAPIKADDSMVIAGGILPAFAAGQEGELRASAVVIAQRKKICLISCDVLMLQRDLLDAACACIANKTGIPFDNIMISATHTHHAPVATNLHGYTRDSMFCSHVTEAIISSAIAANNSVAESECYFGLGHENTVGQNSRVILEDGTILWVPLEPDSTSLTPTGPFDPELAVLAFKMGACTQAVLFNHSTHNIGARDKSKRSPGFYGLAAQELEEQLGATVVFLPGAAGSTHDFLSSTNDKIRRIHTSVTNTLDAAHKVHLTRIESIKREFEYSVRSFDEHQEEKAVSYYCNKRRVDWCKNPQEIIETFRYMRQGLEGRQREVRRSWLHICLVGDIALVGVPGELFGSLGADIKRQSPFSHTYVIGLANDYIGYIPDAEAYRLGGYQVWMGLHSFLEPGTGESIVAEAVRIMNTLKYSKRN